MATSYSSSSSSQGLAPKVVGERKQTLGDLIIYSLENLTGCDFKRIRNKLSDFTYGDIFPIPRGRLENADCINTKELLIDTYGEEGALDVTIKVFTLVGLMGPANDLQERSAQNTTPKKMTHDNRLSVITNEYRELAKETFQKIKQYNPQIGEAVHLQKRCTKSSMIKGPQNKEGKEEEIRSSGIRHLQIMEKRSDEYSPTTIQALFDPDEDGFIPKIVVLQIPAGIGKTMISKKIMLDWASGTLYHDKFDFVFYLSCREINTISGNISLVGLLSQSCRLQSSDDLLSILKDPGSQRKLLTIVDGFDQLRWTLEEKSEGSFDISMETDKEIVLQRLLRKQVLQQSSLIITTRSLAMEKLNTFIHDSRNVEIQGFTKEDQEEYVHKFFGNKQDADKVLSLIKDNDVLYTMCDIPITCWIVCTAMTQEIKKDLSLIWCNTMTSIYLLFLEILLTHHSKKEQSVSSKKTCLKKLCGLANHGVLNQQIVFEENDLERHGLSLSEVESVFPNENIFHRDVCNQSCYSFIHLSVQEFLAALYYGLNDGSGSMEGTSLPEICKGESLSGFSSSSSHLVLAVQFLFGLLDINRVKTFSEITGINISLRARPAIKEWAMNSINQSIRTQTLFCLYETQDEDFIKSVMCRCSRLTLSGSHIGHLRTNSNYSKQLSYCLKALKRESFRSLDFVSLTVDPECQKILSPYLHRSQKIGFVCCTISSKDCPGEDNAEDEEEFGSEDRMKSANLSFLINPGSKVQELGLYKCGLTSSCWYDLRCILIANRSLMKLNLADSNLQDTGMKDLCKGLGHPGCTLQELRVLSCEASFSCSDELCTFIKTNQTLTQLGITLYDDGKMLDSEVRHSCTILQNAGFTVNRGNGRCWNVSIDRTK